MEQQKIIEAVALQVQSILEHEASGHDWWHVYRVWMMARQIAQKETANSFVIELAALLHDVADWKLHDGDDTVGPRRAREILAELGVEQTIIESVADIIQTMSFKGAGVADCMKTLEGKIVQDADRLDAIGAIGVARTFAYGGFKNNPMHDPRVSVVMHDSKDAYLKHQGTTVNHFYEKLFLLKDRMNTKTARAMAEQRHAFMEQFLQTFFAEWQAER